MTAVLVEGNADQVRIGPGKIYVGPFGDVTLPTTLAAATADATLITDGWREAGFTIEGSVVNYTQTSERLRPIKFIITAVEMTFEITLAQMNPENLRLATNSPASSITSTVDEIKFVWPKSGGTSRVSILWVSDDGLEALALAKCFAGGDISIPRRKGADPTAIGVTFNIEENAGGDDAWYIIDADLAAA